MYRIYQYHIAMRNITKKVPDTHDRNFIGSLRKGFFILESFPKLGPKLTLTELARATGMSLGATTKYVSTLQELGYLTRDPSDKKYRLTPKVLSFGFSMLQKMDLRTRVTPYLTEVCSEFGVGAQCAILDEAEIVYVERLRSRALVALDLTVGSRLPAYCTALGRAILAFIEPDALKRIFGKMDMVKTTPYTTASKGKLLKKLELVRQRGYAINIQELVLGQSALAAPVFRGNKVEGSIGFSLPSDLMDQNKLRTSLIERMLEIADKTSVK